MKQSSMETMMLEFEAKNTVVKRGLELYGIESYPHSHDVIVACPYCDRIIKGYGSMRGHIRWKHLPKHYGEVYCIADKNRMIWYDKRKYKLCLKCLLEITKNGVLVKLPRSMR